MFDGVGNGSKKPIENEFVRCCEELQLIAPLSTRAGMASFDSFAYQQQGGEKLYFGTGLSTTKAITRGLPFDFLGMVVGAEFTRRKLGFEKIIHEISDTHALANGFASKEDIALLARDQRSLVSTMIKNLGLSDTYDCVLASQYQNSPAYQKTLADVKSLRPEEGHYFHYQWAGMNWLANQRNVRVKVGWLTDDNQNPGGFDERRFDVGYDSLSLTPLNYVYLKSGRNISSTRTRVSPYTSIEGEDRIMLARNEDAIPTFERWLQSPLTKDTRSTITHLANIVEGFERLFGPIEGIGSVWGNPRNDALTIPSVASNQPSQPIAVTNLAEKINGILDSVFELSPREPNYHRNPAVTRHAPL